MINEGGLAQGAEVSDGAAPAKKAAPAEGEEVSEGAPPAEGAAPAVRRPSSSVPRPSSSVPRPSGPTFESHPLPSSAPLEVFDEDDTPAFGPVLVGTLFRPWPTIIESLPALAETKSGAGSILGLFLFAALMWGCSLVFYHSAPSTPTFFLEVAALSLVCPTLLITIQTALVALGSASFTGQAFTIDFKALFVRFALIWAVANLVLMTISALVEIILVETNAPFPASWLLAVLAALWCLALNFRVVTGYYPYDYGRALLLIFLSQITANLIAFAILYVALMQ